MIFSCYIFITSGVLIDVNFLFLRRYAEDGTEDFLKQTKAENMLRDIIITDNTMLFEKLISTHAVDYMKSNEKLSKKIENVPSDCQINLHECLHGEKMMLHLACRENSSQILSFIIADSK